MLFPNQTLQVDQGADFAQATYAPWTVNGAAVDLSAYTTRLMIRIAPSDPVPILSITQAPNGNGSSAIGTVAGIVNITLGHADTLLLPYSSGPLLYELFVVSGGGAVTPLQSGTVLVNPSVVH